MRMGKAWIFGCFLVLAGAVPTTAQRVNAPKSTAPVSARMMPQFKGDVNQWLQLHIRYPDVARENSIQGKVIVRFMVDEEGGIKDVQLVRGIGGGCDEEAMRVIRSMPVWEPGKDGGKPMRVYMVQEVRFRLKDRTTQEPIPE